LLAELIQMRYIVEIETTYSLIKCWMFGESGVVRFCCRLRSENTISMIRAI
jgi:hypothetical protein